MALPNRILGTFNTPQYEKTIDLIDGYKERALDVLKFHAEKKCSNYAADLIKTFQIAQYKQNIIGHEAIEPEIKIAIISSSTSSNMATFHLKLQFQSITNVFVISRGGFHYIAWNSHEDKFLVHRENIIIKNSERPALRLRYML